MTRVEELLEGINKTLDAIANEISPCFTRDYIGLDDDFDSLISAARSEGVAEGAEQKRLEILADDGTLVQEFCEQDVYVVRCEVLDKPPVLAPTKEKP